MSGFDPILLPRDPSLSDLSTDQIAQLLLAASAMAEAELTAMGNDLARWHPAPGEWCANEVVGHLLEADRRGFAGRIRRILAAPIGIEPDEPGWDQGAVAAARGDCVRPAADLVAELRAGRADAADLVRSLHPEHMQRAATHARVGRVTVRELLHEWLFHDRNHLGQLLKNVQARTWPVMGNTRRFTVPEA